MDPKEAALSHLEALRVDTRDEIKRRIQQRDQYSMQLTVSLGAIVVGAFSASGTYRVFVLAPLVAIYFTALILYSYRIHDVLARYLRDVLEPEFEKVCGVPKEKEWETWYKANERVGIRSKFFVYAMWAVTLLSMAFVWYKDWQWPMPCYHLAALSISTVVYLVFASRVSSLRG